VVGELWPAVWPLVATMAVVCGARIRDSRRRVALNRALHELRRPLQTLALAPGGLRRGSPGELGPLDLALVALDDLDVAVNRSRPRVEPRRISARALVESALERWRGEAARTDRSLSLEWRAGRALVMADPARIAQALDNLLANALEHGGLRIRLEASICAAGVRISVCDGGAARMRSRRRSPRRGHGLEIVRAIAEAHGGHFDLGRDAHGTVASLELPLAPTPVVVPIELAARRRPRRAPRPTRHAPAGPAGPRAA
jgi:signal transduction histidine kinase